MQKIGITTTIPAEIIYAAGAVPVDLNNIFITSPHKEQAIAAAELAGYPRTVCGWIKGIYGMVAKFRAVDKLVAVSEGDCSQTHALMETLEELGVVTLPFAYPFDRDEAALKRQMDKLASALGAGWPGIEREKERLDEARRPVWEIDRLAWQEGLVSGWENHYYQVSCSDFEGDPEAFAKSAAQFISRTQKRNPLHGFLRLGFIGVPPIFDDLYEYLQEQGALVVFNEVQRQFSLPYERLPFLRRYLAYTYPYHVAGRAADIAEQVETRRIDALIHYAQSFCFRQIEDIYFRKRLRVPILSLEGDGPGPLDARTKMRIETFLSMLKK